MEKSLFFLAAFVFLIQSALSAESQDDIKKKIFTKCQKEHNVPESNTRGTFELESTQGLKDHKCFVKCVFEQYKFIKPDGSVDGPLILEALKEDWKTPENEKKYAPVVKGCLSKMTKTADPCDYTYKLLDCYIEGKKKV